MAQKPLRPDGVRISAVGQHVHHQRPYGIRVNAVAPGVVWTPLQPATQPGGKLTAFGADAPLGRAGQPGEVAPAFVFLASPADAGYVSATVLGVTGGKPVF